MTRMKTVKITFIVASSALPMVPNAAIEMYTVGNKTEYHYDEQTMRMVKHQALILRDV